VASNETGWCWLACLLVRTTTACRVVSAGETGGVERAVTRPAEVQAKMIASVGGSAFT